MVREARFCWDDSDGGEPPYTPNRRDDLEDDLLDPDPPVTGKRSAEPAEQLDHQRKRRRREAETNRRHLAGADWISPQPTPDSDETNLQPY